MADQQAKGSILLKIVIVIFLVGLIMVIIVPGQIWEAEEQAMEVSRANMLSIYEAHKYYHQVKNEYAPDMENLILTIQNDSSLLNLSGAPSFKVTSGLGLVISGESFGTSTGFFSVSIAIISAGAG